MMELPFAELLFAAIPFVEVETVAALVSVTPSTFRFAFASFLSGGLVRSMADGGGGVIEVDGLLCYHSILVEAVAVFNLWIIQLLKDQLWHSDRTH